MRLDTGSTRMPTVASASREPGSQGIRAIDMSSTAMYASSAAANAPSAQKIEKAAAARPHRRSGGSRPMTRNDAAGSSSAIRPSAIGLVVIASALQPVDVIRRGGAARAKKEDHDRQAKRHLRHRDADG